MQSYYDILGIPVTAGNNEIKAAFRRLAKLYHPDKNPHGKEHFEKVLIAYEVLIDSSRRRQYDLKLKHGRTMHTSAKATAKKKEWNFNEEDLKRRQYYKENYKKEYQRAQFKSHVYPEKAVYNEYKYILFAAPLAVALLMFVINSYDRGNGNDVVNAPEEYKADHKDLTGEAPYNSYFKSPQYDTASARSIRFNNPNHYDAVLCLFSCTNKFIRCSYLQAGNGLEMLQLPMDSVIARIMLGKGWNPSKKTASDVYGTFDSIEGYYLLKHRLVNTMPVVLDADFLKENNKISEAEFFRKD
ncbi:MAG: J domain-containing protein [Bacteroidia bacterium]